jgi:hypothetical protein
MAKEDDMPKLILRTLSHLFSFRAHTAIFVLAPLLAIGLGCSQKQQILIPPKVDLTGYRTIGIIEFSSNAEKDLNQYLTQRYMQTVQAAQPGVSFIELGKKMRLLKSVRRQELDYHAIKSIAKKHKVDAIMFGHLRMSKMKPKIKWSSALDSMKARVEVEALLSTRLWETENGATVWTNSSQAKDSVANIKMGKHNLVKFGISDPEDKYGKLVHVLVNNNTYDFRSHYEYR